MSNSGSDEDNQNSPGTDRTALFGTLTAVMAMLGTLQLTFAWTGGPYSLFLALVFALASLGSRASKTKSSK